MKFKDYIKEAVIDIPRRTYAKGVFDEADTDNPKLKDSVKSMIDNILTKIEDAEGYSIIKTGLIGSILTKRYRDDADLDINVLFSVPPEKQEDERLRLSKKYLAASPVKIQGQKIPGTEHPVNFYFITDKQTYDEQENKGMTLYLI